MKWVKPTEIFVIVFFVLISVFSFRTYFITHQVPLPFNLLVFLYSPWKYQSWSGYPLGIPNKPMGFDNLKLFYPYRKFTIDEMKAGHIPLWNPYVFSGNVHAATYQSAVFYPFNILYFILPLVDAWSILVVIQPILVGWFSYLFLRSLGQSKTGSLLGSLGFALSGWMIALWEEVLVMVHSVLWLPLALYASNLIWDGRRKKGFFLLVIALASSVLAGFLQMSVYVFTTVLAWNIYRWLSSTADSRRLRRELFTIVLGFVGGISLSAVQWIPALEAYFLSSRGTVNAKFLFDQFLSPINHIITFLVPDFWGNPGSYNYFSPLVYIQERTIYVGIFVLLLALLVFFLRSKREINFWKVFTLVTLSLGFALPTSWIWYILRVPILSAAQPARIFALSTFGISVLAGYGWDRIQEKDAKHILKRIVYVFAVVIGVLWVFCAGVWLFIKFQSQLESACIGNLGYLCQSALYWYGQKSPYKYATISMRNLVLPTFFVLVAWVNVSFLLYKRRIFTMFVFILTIGGGLYFANKVLYFSDRNFEFPDVAPIAELKKISGFDRIASYGNGYIIRNLLSYYRIPSPEGYDALYSERYGELLYTIQNNGKITNQINRTDVTLSEIGQNEPMKNNPIRLRLMSLVGVKYVLEHKEDETKVAIAPAERFPPDLFTLAWENGQWRIWNYTRALPRAFIAHEVRVENNPQKIADIILNSETDLQKTVILEESVPKKGEISDQDKVTILDYQPNKVTIRADAKTDGFLVLSDTYFPGWSVLVDGTQAKMYRADYAFRAVHVTPGMHTITFLYDPPVFRLAVFITGTGVVFCLAVFLLIKSKPIG